MDPGRISPQRGWQMQSAQLELARTGGSNCSPHCSCSLCSCVEKREGLSFQLCLDINMQLMIMVISYQLLKLLKLKNSSFRIVFSTRMLQEGSHSLDISNGWWIAFTGHQPNVDSGFSIVVLLHQYLIHSAWQGTIKLNWGITVTLRHSNSARIMTLMPKYCPLNKSSMREDKFKKKQKHKPAVRDVQATRSDHLIWWEVVLNVLATDSGNGQSVVDVTSHAAFQTKTKHKCYMQQNTTNKEFFSTECSSSLYISCCAISTRAILVTVDQPRDEIWGNADDQPVSNDG